MPTRSLQQRKLNSSLFFANYRIAPPTNKPRHLSIAHPPIGNRVSAIWSYRQKCGHLTKRANMAATAAEISPITMATAQIFSARSAHIFQSIIANPFGLSAIHPSDLMPASGSFQAPSSAGSIRREPAGMRRRPKSNKKAKWGYFLDARKKLPVFQAGADALSRGRKTAGF